MAGLEGDPGRKKCTSCGKWKSEGNFSGKATCNECRVRKRVKSAESVATQKAKMEKLTRTVQWQQCQLIQSQNEAKHLRLLLRTHAPHISLAEPPYLGSDPTVGLLNSASEALPPVHHHQQSKRARCASIIGADAGAAQPTLSGSPSLAAHEQTIALIGSLEVPVVHGSPSRGSGSASGSNFASGHSSVQPALLSGDEMISRLSSDSDRSSNEHEHDNNNNSAAALKNEPVFDDFDTVYGSCLQPIAHQAAPADLRSVLQPARTALQQAPSRELKQQQQQQYVLTTQAAAVPPNNDMENWFMRDSLFMNWNAPDIGVYQDTAATIGSSSAFPFGSGSSSTTETTKLSSISCCDSLEEEQPQLTMVDHLIKGVCARAPDPLQLLAVPEPFMAARTKERILGTASIAAYLVLVWSEERLLVLAPDSDEASTSASYINSSAVWTVILVLLPAFWVGSQTANAGEMLAGFLACWVVVCCNIHFMCLALNMFPEPSKADMLLLIVQFTIRPFLAKLVLQHFWLFVPTILFALMVVIELSAAVLSPQFHSATWNWEVMPIAMTCVAGCISGLYFIDSLKSIEKTAHGSKTTTSYLN